MKLGVGENYLKMGGGGDKFLFYYTDTREKTAKKKKNIIIIKLLLLFASLSTPRHHDDRRGGERAGWCVFFFYINYYYTFFLNIIIINKSSPPLPVWCCNIDRGRDKKKHFVLGDSGRLSRINTMVVVIGIIEWNGYGTGFFCLVIIPVPGDFLRFGTCTYLCRCRYNWEPIPVVTASCISNPSEKHKGGQLVQINVSPPCLVRTALTPSLRDWFCLFSHLTYFEG